LTEEELAENERLWFEEREKPDDAEVEGSDLRSIGISNGDLESDAETAENLPDEEAMGEVPPGMEMPGGEGPPPMPGPGGMPPPPM
jgi:hypothetical protein